MLESEFQIGNSGEDITLFTKRLYWATSVQKEYEDIKVLSRYLWEIFSCWTFVHGQKETDVIQDWIEQM